MAIKLEMLPLLLLSGGAAVAAQKFAALPAGLVFSATFGVGTLIYLTYWCYIYPFYISPLRKVPTVPGFPLWGQFFTIIAEEVGTPNREWHKTYGPIVRYFFPFGAERLSIADDDALNHMCIKNPYNFPKPDRARQWMVRILGMGVLLAEGNPHKTQRKALAPGFSIQSIKALTPVFWRKALLLSKLWERDMLLENTRSKTIEILEWLNRATLDIIGEAGFGTDLDSLEHPETPIREAYRLVFAFDISSRVLHGLAAFVPLTKYLPAKMNRDMLSARNIIISKANDIVRQKHQKTHAKDKDIIALIVKDNMKQEAAGETSLSFETMRDQVMTFLGAGHDTTATGVCWTLHLLSTHPEIQERLRAEIKAYCPFLFDPSIRNDVDRLSKLDADNLHYLDNVCRESLRYIPPIPMTVRQSLTDDRLGGYDVPAGTTVYIHANAIHRLPSFWGDNADAFDPDRWDNLPADHTSNAFMTFLQGPRGCIGRKFAETEMKCLVVSLLSMYRFERDEGVPDPEAWKMWRLVLRPRDGVSCRVSLLEAEVGEKAAVEAA
jgi:cytochrome P450